MRALQERTVMVMTLLLVAFAVAQAAPTTVLVASAAAVAVASVLAVRHAVLAIAFREMTVGDRAHAHREALSGTPAPQHPATAGRPRTRAPSRLVPAA
ncbi:MAG TPA: hypothetical protein DCP11_05550 [Microbacteriaceae bacterium]|jgi:hypothetical protein|nr:hypothetical protein [Microbacteriaceae bacterium]